MNLGCLCVSAADDQIMGLASTNLTSSGLHIKCYRKPCLYSKTPDLEEISSSSSSATEMQEKPSKAELGIHESPCAESEARKDSFQ